VVEKMTRQINTLSLAAFIIRTPWRGGL